MVGLDLGQELLGAMDHVELQAGGGAILLDPPVLGVQADGRLVLPDRARVLPESAQDVPTLVGDPSAIRDATREVVEDLERLGMIPGERQSLGQVHGDFPFLRRRLLGHPSAG